MDENPVVGSVNPEHTEPSKTKRSFWQSILSSRSRTLGFLAILVIIAAIPLTVIISQQQQETRQRAASVCSGSYESIADARRAAENCPSGLTGSPQLKPDGDYQVCCPTTTSCTPKTCVQLGKTSGTWDNSCGGTVNCTTTTSTTYSCAPAVSQSQAQSWAQLCVGGIARLKAGTTSTWEACCPIDTTNIKPGTGNNCSTVSGYSCILVGNSCSGTVTTAKTCDNTGLKCCISATAKIDGACGTAATVYPSTATTFTGTFCSSGNPNPTIPSFPTTGQTTWSCQGLNGGTNVSCTASKSTRTNIACENVGTDAKGYTYSCVASCNGYDGSSNEYACSGGKACCYVTTGREKCTERCSNVYKYYWASWSALKGHCEDSENGWTNDGSKVYTAKCSCLDGDTTHYNGANGAKINLSDPSAQCNTKVNCDKTPDCTEAVCTQKTTTGNSCSATSGTQTCEYTQVLANGVLSDVCTKQPIAQDCKASCQSTLPNCVNNICQLCPSGQSKPFYSCQTNTCQQNNNTCGTNSGGCTSAGGSCGTIACTSPNSNPHFVCTNNTCVSVATCAENSGGCTSAGGSCGTTGSMTLAFNIGFDGIGAAGDHPLPCTSFASCNSNKNPQRTTRDLTVSVFDQSNVNKTPNTKITVTYDAATGTFKGNASANLTPGNYTVKVKSPGLLTKTLVSIQSLVSGTNQIPSANLTTGDIDNDNQLTVLDYNILISCSIYTNDAETLCNRVTTYKTYSDLNDNGVVDQIDYNLFLREYSVQNGD